MFLLITVFCFVFSSTATGLFHLLYALVVGTYCNTGNETRLREQFPVIINLTTLTVDPLKGATSNFKFIEAGYQKSWFLL